MTKHEFSRRAMLKSSAALAALAALGLPSEALAALAADAAAQAGEVVVPWLDQPPPFPGSPDQVATQLVWEQLGAELTPNEQFFTVQHYGPWLTLRERDWRLNLDGLALKPRSLSLAELRARPRQQVTFTLECSGNHGFPFFTGGIGTAVWAGTPLAPLLREAGWQPDASEVVFWGADAGPGPVGEQTIVEQFARSLSLADALNPNMLLCYEMNGVPLHPAHGFPLRLIAPGWYGVANVKWLTRIELANTRYEGRFMARDYVTQRVVQQGERELTRFTSVGRALLKSAPARVVRGSKYRIEGVAWGAPIGRVEVRLNEGPWRQAYLVGEAPREGFAWRRWALDWGQPAAGEYAVTARAFDTSGRVQPAPDDPQLATKRTYWESNGQITRRVRIPKAGT
jgi:DMSO/TMAO reductase YedYZ molybdopterin-dependent catalytic subunit